MRAASARTFSEAVAGQRLALQDRSASRVASCRHHAIASSGTNRAQRDYSEGPPDISATEALSVWNGRPARGPSVVGLGCRVRPIFPQVRKRQAGRVRLEASTQARWRWGVSDMIELLCAAHLEASKIDPTVTAVDGGRWAFCVGGATEGHDWRDIEPTALGPLRVRPRQRLQDLLDHGALR